MSILTKILIVLLAFSSFFLCATVVTYVATANNYKQQYEELQAERDAFEENAKSFKSQLTEKIDETDRQKKKLNNEIASLKIEFGQLQGRLKNVEREKADLLQRVNGWAAIVREFRETNDHQGRLLEKTLDDLKKVKAEQFEERKELSETSDSLMEKMGIIETLVTEKKRLLEQKTELQKRLDQFLQPFGKTAIEPVPVTPRIGKVGPVIRTAEDIDLHGLITVVDLKNSMASISIGSADGVKEGMRFHVTRGDDFICDILIIDIDAEDAVGILKLVQQQQQPRIGDNVSTNL